MKQRIDGKCEGGNASNNFGSQIALSSDGSFMVVSAMNESCNFHRAGGLHFYYQDNDGLWKIVHRFNGNTENEQLGAVGVAIVTSTASLNTLVYASSNDDRRHIRSYKSKNTVYYRISNAAYTGWRPAVTEFWMKDADGNMIENGTLICSGSHTNEKGCSNAVDMVYPWWRPQCAQCDTNEAWIGYEVVRDVVVVEAYAKGLGIGCGGDMCWNGGVALQRSEDGGNTWEDIGYTENSDAYY